MCPLLDMNLEDEEFLESDLNFRRSDDDSKVSEPIDISKITWRRKICMLNVVELDICTVAYGGTFGSGRKIYHASEIFASWLLISKYSRSFYDKVVFELGCGCSGLPGIATSISGAKQVNYVDNDILALLELRSNLSMNLNTINDAIVRNGFQKYSIECGRDDGHSFLVHHLAWTDIINASGAFKNQVDMIIGSEIIYDGCNKHELATTIHSILGDNGEFVLCQNKFGRGGIDEFLEYMLSYNFVVKKLDESDEETKNLLTTMMNAEDDQGELLLWIFSKGM